MVLSKPVYQLLDDEGNVIRYFDYPAQGAVLVVEPKLSYDELLAKFGECLL